MCVCVRACALRTHDCVISGQPAATPLAIRPCMVMMVMVCVWSSGVRAGAVQDTMFVPTCFGVAVNWPAVHCLLCMQCELLVSMVQHLVLKAMLSGLRSAGNQE